jgi:hypothetical protein
METFQNFYNGQALYDLTRQWIKSASSFTYEYRWLQPNGTNEQVKGWKEWADRIFANAFGLAPDNFRHLDW